MNTLTLRKALRPICDQLWPKRNVSTSPLFVWHGGAEAQKHINDAGWSREAVRAIICTPEYLECFAESSLLPNGEVVSAGASATRRPPPMYRLPFDSFMIHMPAHGDVPAQLLVVVNNPDSPSPDFLRATDVPGWENYVVGITAPLVEARVNTNVLGYSLNAFDLRTGRQAAEPAFSAIIEGAYRWACRDLDGSRISVPAIDDLKWCAIWRTAIAWRLRAFLFEVFYPANHLVRVAPKSAGRSVEWVQARSHLVLMDRKSMAGATRGARQRPDDDARVLRRAAHARIAHYRILRAPRFGANVGKMVPVRCAWVGPKEWEGSDAKTYVVLDPLRAA